MLKKINTIKNFGIFKDFAWDCEVLNKGGAAQSFVDINIIYGRNYSGKTTLSRILRSLETGRISDKYESPLFSLKFADKPEITQSSLAAHGKKVRVFNEDFIRDNLRFISNPDENIEPFAILGDDNNKIEQEIEKLEAELGSKDEGKETALYAKRKDAATKCDTAFKAHKNADDNLVKQLGDKATNQKIGIKYQPERFGDQNYNISKLRSDIEVVQGINYQALTNEQLVQYEKLILEKTLPDIPSFRQPSLSFESLATEVEALVTRKISESDKIEELVKDAVLNRWVNEGRTHHKEKRDNCAFCDSSISEERWNKLEKHFDEESEQLEKDIDVLIGKIEAEKKSISSALSINKVHFYSSFHSQLDSLDAMLKDAVEKYERSLDALITQLNARKEDALNPKVFELPRDASAELVTVWSSYKTTCTDSDEFTSSLSTEQANAKSALRLNEVSDYLLTIGYQAQLDSIAELKEKLDAENTEKTRINGEISQKEALVATKKRELNDEEKGAKKVNEYLTNFFGHQFLTLEAKKDELGEEGSKRIRFEVIRDGKKAYHLSEGECSLLAFCYFLAKLDDIDTRDSKPIIWIDDPISSLDGNHIFFVYSLLNAEVVSAGKFKQLFVSTHNLDFLKYLKRLNGAFIDSAGKPKSFQKNYFVIERKEKISTIQIMPNYLKEYVTEFNYLFHQIHKCSVIETIDDTNYISFYNFANNSRKFFEIYLYYKYPDQGMNEATLNLFFGEDKIPAVLTDRINNEYSHLSGVFERGATPLVVPEMQTAARQIIERLQEDRDQYSALLKSIGEYVEEEGV